MSTVSDATPLSCSTGLSKEVLAHLSRLQLTGHAWNVCAHFHGLSFGNAGWHRKQGDAEISCTFDLAVWASALHVNRSQLLRTMQRLVKHSVLTMEPLPNQPGRYTLTWNVNFHEWLPGYDSHRTAEQAKNLGERAQKRPSSLSTVDEIKVPSRLSLPVKIVTIESKHANLHTAIESKHASFGTAPHAAPPALNKSTEEEYTEEEIRIAAHAAQGSLFPVVPLIAKKASTLPARHDSKKERPPDLLWDKAVELFGYAPRTKSGRGAWNTAIKDLRGVDATPDDLQRAYEAWPNVYAGARCTLNAIAKHFDDLLHELQKGLISHGEPEIYAHYL